MGGKKNYYGATGRDDILKFPPDLLKVITDPKHPQYDPRVARPADEALVSSIMEHGVLVPLLVTRDGEDVYVIDGRQRRAAALEANRRLRERGLAEVLAPCTWKRGDDAKLFAVAVTTNEVRTGDRPLERAKKMQHALDLGYTVDQAAVMFGVVAKTVKNHLALLECDVKVQRAVEAGTVTATVAAKLAAMPREQQCAALDEMVAAGTTKGAAADRAVRAKRGHASVPRLRSRKHLERLRDEFEGDETFAYELLCYVLGDDSMIDAVPPRWRTAIERASGK